MATSSLAHLLRGRNCSGRAPVLAPHLLRLHPDLSCAARAWSAQT